MLLFSMTRKIQKEENHIKGIQKILFMLVVWWLWVIVMWYMINTSFFQRFVIIVLSITARRQVLIT